jgi:hypothetical protein
MKYNSKFMLSYRISWEGQQSYSLLLKFCCTVGTMTLAFMYAMNFCPDCNAVTLSYFEMWFLVH